VTWWIDGQAERTLEVIPARDPDISSWRL